MTGLNGAGFSFFMIGLNGVGFLFFMIWLNGVLSQTQIFIPVILFFKWTNMVKKGHCRNDDLSLACFLFDVFLKFWSMIKKSKFWVKSI